MGKSDVTSLGIEENKKSFWLDFYGIMYSWYPHFLMLWWVFMDPYFEIHHIIHEKSFYEYGVDIYLIPYYIKSSLFNRYILTLLVIIIFEINLMVKNLHLFFCKFTNKTESFMEIANYLIILVTFLWKWEAHLKLYMETFESPILEKYPDLKNTEVCYSLAITINAVQIAYMGVLIYLLTKSVKCAGATK